jgi:hypothetical protein
MEAMFGCASTERGRGGKKKVRERERDEARQAKRYQGRKGRWEGEVGRGGGVRKDTLGEQQDPESERVRERDWHGDVAKVF